jgi:recombination protein RecA
MDQKQKALGATLSNIEKQFGKGAIMRLGDEATTLQYGVIRKPAQRSR